MRLNPLPFLFAGVFVGTAYMLGGSTAAAWTAIGWFAVVALVSLP